MQEQGVRPGTSSFWQITITQLQLHPRVSGIFEDCLLIVKVNTDLFLSNSLSPRV